MSKRARKISLNIVKSKGNIVPSTASPIEYGSFYYRPESKATGGNAFQHYRNQLEFSYAWNCIPTENGLTSVQLVKKEVQRLPNSHFGKWVTTHCDKCEELMTYPCGLFKSVQDIHDGTLILREDGLFRITGLNPIMREPVETKGILIDNDAILGLLSMRNRNFIYTKDEVYINSMEKWFDYIPAIRTGAGKFSILSYIGHIITMIQAVDSVYIFGTHGAVFSDTCTGDGDYPFRWQKVDNHTGIRNKDDVVSKDGAVRKLIVNSNDGLQMIKDTNAIFILEEESRQLRNGSLAFFDNPCMSSDVCLCEGEYPIIHTLKENSIIGDEFKDSNQENVVNGCFELFLNKVGRQHIRVNNFTNYVAISYGTTEEVECGESCLCFTRLMIYDLVSDRYTIIHVEHTDVERADKNKDEILNIINGNDTYALIEGGIGYVYYKEFMKTNLNGFTISRVQLRGRFENQIYEDEQDQALTYIPAYLGIQQAMTHDDRSMELVGFGNNNITYQGRWRGNYLSFIQPFSGSLNEIELLIV